jgi:hypothetical protein
MNLQQAHHFICTSLLLSAILLASCQSQKERDKAQTLQRQNDSLRTAIDSVRKEFNLRVHKFADVRTGLWRVDTLSESGRLVFAVEYPNATVYEIAGRLNAAFRSDSVPLFKITSVQQHTAFVTILYSRRLTQEIGSTGAQEYLAQITLSLTSVPGIHSVDFDFEEGDHASPGTYDRQRFVDMLR